MPLIAWPFICSKVVLLTALVATTAAMAACGSDSTPTHETTPLPTATPTPGAVESGGVSSDIVNFTHQDLVVSVGTSITWVNRESASHTSTSRVGAAGRCNSRGLGPGETFTFTFNDPGTYEYFCSIHPRMTGTVTVNP